MAKVVFRLSAKPVRMRDRPLTRMTRITTVTNGALVEIRQSYRYAADTMATTLTEAAALSQATDANLRRTPAQETAVYGLTREYLRTLLTLADQASRTIRVDLAHGRSLPQRSAAARKQMEQVSQVFLDQVCMVLRR
jgi:hypothetical protein